MTQRLQLHLAGASTDNLKPARGAATCDADALAAIEAARARPMRLPPP